VKHEDGWLRGVEEVQIYWQAWLPDSAPRASVVLAHGVSEHSARYGHVGEALTSAGYALYALDHRGHGRSDGARANIDRLDHVVADLLQLVERVTKRDGGRKPFLLGHSMGGGISIAFAIEHQDTIEGLLLSGAVADPEAASAATRALSRLTSAIAPGLGVFPVDPAGVSRDPEVVRAYVEDPLVYHDKLPARTVGELIAAVNRFPEQVPGLRLPMLVMHGGDDPITPVAGSRMVAERAGSEDKTLKIYEGLYHEILNEPEQDQVIADIVGWLDERS
jgi:alpha-beta hydrolase superfamily lysophospholipase